MGQEIDKIREVIESKTNYEAGTVWFNGNTIHVTVHDKGEIKTEEKRNVEKQRIQDMITRVVPQYKIDVKLKK
jgi:ABC-type histidine transport system ATPase subunit